MKFIQYIFVFLALGVIFLFSCKEEEDPPTPPNKTFSPTPLTLDFPPHFGLIGLPSDPKDNPLTVEGVALGKKLFYEKKLSKNNVLSCGSCHRPEVAFNDEGIALSRGVDGSLGKRNAMPLFNLAWTELTKSAFNWHGSDSSLEEQAFEPVKNHLEMQETWPNVMAKLQMDPQYPALFNAAFGSNTIDSVLIVKAIAQFERTLLSGNSPFDNYIKKTNGLDTNGRSLNAQETRGLNLFMNESKGDCFHCHGDPTNPLMTDFEFRNNGLDQLPDSGLAEVTKRASDLGKFKTPSVRNLVFTAPYMHDGRHKTLADVINFYTDSVQVNSPNIDGLMQKSRSLNAQEKLDLIAFLESITDSSFVKNPDYRP